jgi:hypothetical protein
LFFTDFVLSLKVSAQIYTKKKCKKCKNEIFLAYLSIYPLTIHVMKEKKNLNYAKTHERTLHIETSLL